MNVAVNKSLAGKLNLSKLLRFAKLIAPPAVYVPLTILLRPLDALYLPPLVTCEIR